MHLVRELAAGDVKRADLARAYGVSTSYIAQFAASRAREIDAVRANLDDQFAGLWAADKAARIEALQTDYEQSAAGDYAGHYEQARTRAQILRYIAEELGQIPNRTSTSDRPLVIHIIEGVQVEVLT